MTNLFKNPLLDVPVDARKGLCVDIPEINWSFLKTISDKHGNLSITINILISKLINECRSRGITDISKLDQFEQLVLSVCFSNRGLRNRSSTRTPRQTDGRNDKRGTSSKGDGDKTPANNTPSLQSGGGEVHKTKNGQGE